MNCFKTPHDNYLENFILPPPSILSNNDYNIVEELKNDVNEKCISVRKSYMKQLPKDLKESDVLENYPINVSLNKKILGSYISNLPYCKFLEKGATSSELILKLDSNSIYEELNIISSILREKLNFKNLIMVFSVDTNVKYDFLELNYIIYKDQTINYGDIEWIELVQSAYTELTLIFSIEHSIWHLIVAHIIYISKRTLWWTEIQKIFNMAEDNVFVKALQVKTLLFGTELIFQQKLNHNEKFKKYLNNKIATFIEKFNIDTVFDDYFNLKTDLNWIHGMKSNIEIIKKFVSKVVDKRDLKNNNASIVKYLARKYNKSEIKNIPTLQKLLEILFVVGTAFHSTTFEFTKIIMTDVFNNEKLNNLFYGISIQTIITDISTVFGEKKLYKGTIYSDEVDYLYSELEKNRKILMNEIDKNKPVFKNNIYTTEENMIKTYSTNTYTTYV